MTLLLTIKEAAQETRRSETWIRQQIRSGQLRTKKFGRYHRILADELLRFIDRKNAVSKTEVYPSNIEKFNRERIVCH